MSVGAWRGALLAPVSWFDRVGSSGCGGNRQMRKTKLSQQLSNSQRRGAEGVGDAWACCQTRLNLGDASSTAGGRRATKWPTAVWTATGTQTQHQGTSNQTTPAQGFRCKSWLHSNKGGRRKETKSGRVGVAPSLRTNVGETLHVTNDYFLRAPFSAPGQ